MYTNLSEYLFLETYIDKSKMVYHVGSPFIGFTTYTSIYNVFTGDRGSLIDIFYICLQ